MNPILQWLQTHDGYTFDEGVAVLLRFSANAGANQIIMRRRDRRHLAAELSRLAHIPNLRPLPGMEEPKTTANEPEPVKAPEPVEGPAQEKEPEPESTNADDDSIVSFLDLNRHEREDSDTLPPTLKELWVKNRDEYKELQYCHTQMKLANSDAGHAEWRKQVFDHRESLQARWKLFDEEKARLAAAAVQTAQSHSEGESKPAYNPGNDRSYITNALKKETWTDKMKLEVQRRVETLLGNNIPITEETLQRLKERGISI